MIYENASISIKESDIFETKANNFLFSSPNSFPDNPYDITRKSQYSFQLYL